MARGRPAEHPACTISRSLSGQAERFCRHFLSNGRREGNYWLVGDLRNAPGRSLYVRLRDSPDGARCGKWTDAQSGEHGDLLDIVRAATATGTMREALDEARRFLNLAEVEPRPCATERMRPRSPGAARRLLAITASIEGTPVEAYLAGRGIGRCPATHVLRYHPRCWYRRSAEDPESVPPAMPAMIAPVTDLSGRITGAHRTWLMADGSGKAGIARPRR